MFRLRSEIILVSIVISWCKKPTKQSRRATTYKMQSQNFIYYAVTWLQIKNIIKLSRITSIKLPKPSKLHFPINWKTLCKRDKNNGEAVYDSIPVWKTIKLVNPGDAHVLHCRNLTNVVTTIYLCNKCKFQHRIHSFIYWLLNFFHSFLLFLL